jgi:hypothetical protein
VLAVVVVLFTRGRLSYEPERAATSRRDGGSSSPTEGAITKLLERRTLPPSQT